MSGLGEPLNAEIELLSVKSDELASIQAMIASEQAYADQSLEKPSAHNSIKVEVTKNSRGEPILKLVSTQPISDAFLDMLIQVEWPTGRLVKEYTVLLDPPGYEQKLTTSPTVNLPSPAPSSENTIENIVKEPNNQTGPKQTEAEPVQTETKQSNTQLSPEQLAREKAKIKYNFKENHTKENAQTTHTTTRGDTLYAIARDNQVEGVSLEQMLIGLYQANPNAFINKNINQLKVGQILNVPDQESLEKISPSQARRQFKAQSTHWNTYKNKLAGLVKQSKESKEESHAQQSAGKVVAAEDKSLPVNTGVKDVVKLSTGDAKSNKSGDKSFQDKVNTLQEEITAKDNAVKEAQSRTADLEKQVSEMQKLLALKNDAMLKLQQNADAASKQMKSAEASPAPSTSQDATNEVAKSDASIPPANTQNTATKDGAEKAPAKTSSQAIQQQTEAPKTPSPAKVEAPQVSPAEPVVKQPSFIGSLVNRVKGFSSAIKLNTVSLIGLLVLPVLGGVWWMFRQRRKKNLASFEDGIMSPSVSDMTVNTVFGNTTGGTVEAGDTSFLTDFSQSAVGGMIDANDVDPIAEAEVYMAYGRDAQAEEILKDAIVKEPKRYELHLKLLEIYQTTQNNSAFEAIAGELYANLGGNDPSWSKVAQMGVKLDPNNPLYQASGQHSDKLLDKENNVDSSKQSNEANASAKLKQTAETSQPKTDYAMPDLNFETPALDLDIGTANNNNKDDLTSDKPTFANSIAFSNTISTFEQQDSDDTIRPDPVIKTPTISEMDFDIESESITAVDSSLDPLEFANTMTPRSLDLPTIDFESATKLEFDADAIDAEIKVTETVDTATLDESVSVSDSGSSEIFKSVPSLNFDADEEKSTTEYKDAPQDDAFDGVEEITLSSMAEENESAPASAQDELTPEAVEEIETKLDLIKAYIDMEDTVGAKELIEEVLKEGTVAQRQHAKQLLAQLS